MRMMLLSVLFFVLGATQAITANAKEETDCPFKHSGSLVTKTTKAQQIAKANADAANALQQRRGAR